MSQITLSSTVADVLRVLASTGQAAVVVWERSAPVGVVSLEDVSSVGAGALVSDVMSHECISIDPAADEPETHHRYVEAAWASLIRRRPLSPESVERRTADAADRDLWPPNEVPSDLRADPPPSVRCS